MGTSLTTISRVDSTDTGLHIVQALDLFTSCLKKWTTPPTYAQYHADYGAALEPWLKPMMEDFASYRNLAFNEQTDPLFETLVGLDWDSYRSRSLLLDPKLELERLQRHMRDVQRHLGVRLEGEVVLFGSFTMMDGYARFNQGTHRVFLGVDESFSDRAYLDILETHELTHVARESKASVWEGFGLDPKMTHDGFVEHQPVIEHLANEGFACLVSEALNPGLDSFKYVYQNQTSLSRLLEHAPAVNRRIHREIQNPEGDYHTLYQVDGYQVPGLPSYAHYTWAWQWMKHIQAKFGQGDPRQILGACSKAWIQDALAFELKGDLR